MSRVKRISPNNVGIGLLVALALGLVIYVIAYYVNPPTHVRRFSKVKDMSFIEFQKEMSLSRGWQNYKMPSLDAPIIRAEIDIDLAVEQISLRHQQDTFNDIAFVMTGDTFTLSDRTLKEYYPCNVELQTEDYKSLTKNERLLIAGYWRTDRPANLDFLPQKVDPIQRLIDIVGFYYLKENKLPDVHTQCTKTYIKSIKSAYQVSEQELEFLISAVFSDLTSPITGDLIEWRYADFSRGNAYIAPISQDSPQWQDLAAFSKLIDVSRSEASFRDDKQYFYVRLYGETGVLVAKALPCQATTD